MDTVRSSVCILSEKPLGDLHTRKAGIHFILKRPPDSERQPMARMKTKEPALLCAIEREGGYGLI